MSMSSSSVVIQSSSASLSSVCLSDEWSPTANCLLSGRIFSEMKSALLSDPVSAEQLIKKLSAVFCISVCQSSRAENVDVCWLVDLEKFPGAIYESKTTEAPQWKIIPRTTFRLSDEVFHDIAVGKLNPMWAVLQRKASVAGDMMKALAFHDHVFKLPHMLALKTMDLSKPFSRKEWEAGQKISEIHSPSAAANANTSSNTSQHSNNQTAVSATDTATATATATASPPLGVSGHLPFFARSVLTSLSSAAGLSLSSSRKRRREDQVQLEDSSVRDVKNSGNESGVVDEPFIENLSNFSDEEKQQIKNLLKLDSNNVVPLGVEQSHQIHSMQQQHKQQIENTQTQQQKQPKEEEEYDDDEEEEEEGEAEEGDEEDEDEDEDDDEEEEGTAAEEENEDSNGDEEEGVDDEQDSPQHEVSLDDTDSRPSKRKRENASNSKRAQEGED